MLALFYFFTEECSKWELRVTWIYRYAAHGFIDSKKSVQYHSYMKRQWRMFYISLAFMVVVTYQMMTPMPVFCYFIKKPVGMYLINQEDRKQKLQAWSLIFFFVYSLVSHYKDAHSGTISKTVTQQSANKAKVRIEKMISVMGYKPISQYLLDPQCLVVSEKAHAFILNPGSASDDLLILLPILLRMHVFLSLPIISNCTHKKFKPTYSYKKYTPCS